MQLLLALRVVSRIESSPVRATVFEDIAGRSWVIRLVLRLYHTAQVFGLEHLLVAGYAASYYVRAVLPKSKTQVLGVGFYANELRSLHLAEGLLAPQKLCKVGWQLLNPAGVIALFSGTGKWYKTWRLIKRIQQQHDFMPACRVMATLFLYIRFRQWFLAHGAQAVIVTSDYSPDGAAMTAAANVSGAKTIYIPHALPSLAIERYYMLGFDYYLLQSEAMMRRFSHWRKIDGEIFYQGVRGSYAPLQLANLDASRVKIGILLSGATRMDRLRELIISLLKQHTPEMILVRGHPVDFTNPDFSALTQIDGRVKISQGAALEEDVGACDVMISSNSTVIVDSLRMGTPTVFYDGLDDLPYDYNGLVSDGLVPAMKDTQLDIAKVKDFFSRDWLLQMQYFDSAYAQDRAQLDEQVSEILQQWVGVR